MQLRDGSTDVLKAFSKPTTDRFVFRHAGENIKVGVGDRVLDTALWPDMDWIVPNITASADAATDIVKGTCADTGNLSDVAFVEIHRTGVTRGFAIPSVDSTGNFKVNFNRRGDMFFDRANIKHGDAVVVRCMLDTGDWVAADFMVP